MGEWSLILAHGYWSLVPGSGPTTVQNRSTNGPKWCQDGVQDGLLGIRAVKRRSWTDTPTVTPIHVADFGGLLGSCWGSCWAYVGTFFRDDFLMPFGRRFGPQHGRKSRPKSSPRPSPRRVDFGLGNRCQKWSKIDLISMEKSLMLDMVFDDFWMRCMSRVCFCWHERMSKKHRKTIGFGTIFEHRPFCLNMRLSSKFDRRGSWNRTCL